MPLWISDDLEMWPERADAAPLRFTHIATLHSELIGVSTRGELHQWRWADSEPYRHHDNPNIFHPKTLLLNLVYEKVVHISATAIRCSVATEQQRIATWMDEQLGQAAAGKLEHAATLFAELGGAGERIAGLYTCTMYTVVRMDSGALHWWGVIPFGQRKRLWDKHKAKVKKPAVRTALIAPEIYVGTQVCMKNSPMYQPGAIGFTISNGVPRVGQLLNAAWDLSDICRFKLITVPPLPSSNPQQSSSLTSNDLKDLLKSSASTAAGASVVTSGSGASTSAVAASTIVVSAAPTAASTGTGPSSSIATALSSANVVLLGAVSKSSGSNKETADRLDMPPPPSPASSTCSDTGSVTSHKRTKRAAPKEDIDPKKDEEAWMLSDVVFVEDVRCIPVGRVLKVDGQYAAVKFPSTTVAPSASVSSGSASGSTSTGTTIVTDKDNADNDSAWQECRLMKKDDLQVMKSATTSRVPDCFQKTPRRISLTGGNGDLGGSELLTLAVDAKGIHAVMRTGPKIHYCLFNLSTGRQENDAAFPTDTGSFLGTCPANIQLTCANEASDSVLLLRDGNNAIYPLVNDCVDAIRDPQWMDLQPIKCIAASTVTLSSVGANLKSQVAILTFVPEIQFLMPRILRCDVRAFKCAIAHLEANDAVGRSQMATVLAERCDGNRNIFHACVAMCSPTRNKDTELESTTAAAGSSAAAANQSSASMDCINNIGSNSNSSGSRGGGGGGEISRVSILSIREVMRRVEANASRGADLDAASNSSSNSGAIGGNNSAGAVGGGAPIDDPVFMPLSYWPPEVDMNSGDEDSMTGHTSTGSTGHNNAPGGGSSHQTAAISSLGSGSNKHGNLNAVHYVSEPAERRDNAVQMLQMLCASPAMQPHLRQILSAKDAQGQTPFMLAVTQRAYQAGLILFNAIAQLAQGDVAVRNTMIFPDCSAPDQSPLYVLCCNDTCSFTWTGADHINQDIFECKTCGLTGSLCCCTECAKVCHKGHDCKLKRTSPTAYCDCWEKCKCKALIAGNQTKRFELLCKLSAETDLVQRLNSRGEPLLLFLIQTVSRQVVEQRQYRSRARNTAGNRKTPSLEAETEMPDHDLEPPRFARKALDRLLVDWQAVMAMIMTGAEQQQQQRADADAQRVWYNEVDDQGMYLQSQSGTTLLDKFTHSLFVRCNSDPLDTLLTTLYRELQNDSVVGRVEEANRVARRFIRSVSRVFVVFSLERVPSPEKQKSSPQHKYVQICRRVFRTLMKISIEELIETADSLIAPVRMGVVRPTAPFALPTNSNIDVSVLWICLYPSLYSNLCICLLFRAPTNCLESSPSPRHRRTRAAAAQPVPDSPPTLRRRAQAAVIRSLLLPPPLPSVRPTMPPAAAR